MKLILTLLLIVSVICAGILVRYAYTRRNMPGAKYFVFLLITAIIYNSGFIGELNARDYVTAKFWFDLEHIAIPLQHYFFLLLSLDFTNLDKRALKVMKYVALYHPILYYVIFFTPGLNRLYVLEYHFIDIGSLSVITSQNGIFYYIMVISGTLIGIVSSIAYINGYLKSSNLQRKIYLLMMVATIFPWLTVYQHAAKLDGGVDYFPFATIITGIIYMFCIFQFKIFHTIPIATEIVFRQAKDAIILLDIEDRIVDANVSAVHIFPELKLSKKKYYFIDYMASQLQLDPVVLKQEKFRFERKVEEEYRYFEVKVQDIQMGNNMYIGKIVRIFDITEMYMEKKEMEKRMTSAIDQVETSEISLLQAQISPHFINNSLSVIASMITRAPEEAKVLITDLGDYLANCYYFDSSTYMVDLEDEIETVKTYVHIEQARFRERLHFHIVGDEIPKIKVPRLIIQPLVENAIRHGILKKIEGGNVWLKIQISQSSIEFEIKDDGVGMSEEFLNNLLSKDSERKGIGVRNINSRLLKYYGEGVTIVSALERGTSIWFRIPVSKM